jgi:hypothetical protein
VLIGLGVLMLLVAIIALALGARRTSGRLAILGVVMIVLASIGVGNLLQHLPGIPTTSSPPALGVRASASGGWDVSIPSVDGATTYSVSINGHSVGSFQEAGDHHVPEPPWPARSYAPAPQRTFTIKASDSTGRAETITASACAPVVMLVARGSYENQNKPTFADGIGSRGWRTWHYLAAQLGVASTTAGQEPTVVLASPVQYPATIVNLSTDYQPSRDAGVYYLGALWRATIKDCPDSKIVALGYSQGADVVASVWQQNSLDTTNTAGVVLYADPHFNRKWVDQGIVYPTGGVWKHNGLLGSRPAFANDRADVVQAWCWPADPVCQTAPSLSFHGVAYDCYEEWAAYKLATILAPALREQGYAPPAARQPTCPLATNGR